jgi:hypothetical protein
MRKKEIDKSRIYPVPTLLALIIVLTTCTKDNTDHPDHGKITSLTVDWANRGAGIDIPDSYTVSIGDYSTTLSGAVNSVEHLFFPGRYPLYIYNTPIGITANGVIATANYNVNGGIGWFFSGKESIAIERDTEYSFTVEMQQQVRQLILELDITGDARDRLIGIDGTLSGVARTINIDDGTPTGTTATTPFSSTQEGGKFISDIRLLGIAGDTQNLSLTLHFAEGNPATYTVTSDLSNRLSAFNTGKITPMTLSSIVVITPTQAGLATEISDWIPGGTSTGIAD